MKAACYVGERTLKTIEAQPREPAAGEVRLDVSHTGICGTDLHIFTARWTPRAPSGRFGHEMSGTIARGPGSGGLFRRPRDGDASRRATTVRRAGPVPRTSVRTWSSRNRLSRGHAGSWTVRRMCTLHHLPLCLSRMPRSLSRFRWPVTTSGAIARLARRRGSWGRPIGMLIARVARAGAAKSSSRDQPSSPRIRELVGLKRLIPGGRRT